MPTPRLPQPSDFPKSLTVKIVPNPESPGRAPMNVLMLLHGLGDTEAPFANMGRQLNLPSTCVLAIRAPHPLPFDLGGFHWGDDVTIDQSSGSLDPDAGFNITTRLLRDEVITKGLIEKCGFTYRNILLWGFGQGGMVALNLSDALEETVEGASASAASAALQKRELGGVISIGGPLPESVKARNGKEDKKCRTPVLILGGASGTAITDGQVDRIKRVFEFVERTQWRRSGDGMPRDRGEMMPIMQFLARRLKTAAPDGTVEI